MPFPRNKVRFPSYSLLIHNDDYTVKVRQVGKKEWVDLYEYNVKVDMDTKSDATMVQFDFSGKVEVLVQKNNGEIRSDFRLYAQTCQSKQKCDCYSSQFIHFQFLLDTNVDSDTVPFFIFFSLMVTV